MPTHNTTRNLTENVRQILMRESKLRDWKVFEMELKEFLESSERVYYFLSEDYYEHYLTKEDDGSLILSVMSDKPEVVERTSTAQEKLSTLVS